MTPNEELSEALDRLSWMQRRILELKREATELASQIVEWTGVGVTIHRGESEQVEVKQPKKFSAAEAEKVLTIAPALLALVRVESTTIPAAKAKELLPPDLYAKCQVDNGKPTVTFKVRKDDE